MLRPLLGYLRLSLSARRAWIEMDWASVITAMTSVALRKESVDRNSRLLAMLILVHIVALRKESVDRNARKIRPVAPDVVALRKESVDRNSCWLLA